MELALVCITIGYVFGCIVGFIGGRFIQKKDVEKFKADYHELCKLKDIRIQKLENEIKAAKEIIRRFYRLVFFREDFMELNDFNVWKSKIEDFLKE